MKEPLYLGCTAATHKRIGVHAVVNARSGELWRNDFDDREEIERKRDALNMERIKNRVRVYQWNSKWFRRRFSHLLSRYDD